MKCPKCQQETPIQAKFCSECGTKLPLACPQCGTEIEATAKYCSECGARLIPKPKPTTEGEIPKGSAAPTPRSYTPPHLTEKILHDRATLIGERRTVTVLFSDAVGFTPLSERLNEEEVYHLMQECLRRMMDAVHLYEGTITQFRGDGVMALFGAPIAHEDSARRAVAAGLEMQRSLGEYAVEVEQRHPIKCRFRVGLNTGPVVMGSINDNLDIDFTALGDTVNLAARMEQVGEPGAVFLSENSYQAVKHYFECEPLGALEVKGKAERVVAYKALKEKTIHTRLQVSAERGFTPFVGRDQELTGLGAFFERAKNHQGQVVLISGEAGIGKSRLMLEFRHSIQHEDVIWIEGYCISYGEHIPYRPIIDILKHAFGVEEDDDEAKITQCVDEATSGWDEATRSTVPYLKYLLNVDPGETTLTTMNPQERQAGIFDGVRALLLQESRRQPLVVTVEDLHWIDEQSEEVLATLVDVIASAPVLLILSCRPDYTHSLGERTYFNRLTLGNLPPEESAAMIEGVLQVANLPQELRELINNKAEGNPFYIEEVTQSLTESGVLERIDGTYSLNRPMNEIRVPDTIQEVILSRIDRLEQQEREALQLASVIGREFTATLLDRISDLEARLEKVLEDLQAVELIYQKAYSPELSYIFKHALTHDVAYSTLLRESQKSLHRLIGATIEELYADRLTEHFEVLAYHYSEGEEWRKALDYLVKAGDKAADTFANRDALDYYARAIEVCQKLGDSTLAISADVAQKRGWLNFSVADLPEGISDFNLMSEAARRLGDRHLEGMALGYRGHHELFFHDQKAAENTLKTALEIGDEGFEDVRYFASAVFGLFLIIYDRHTEVEPFFRTAKELMIRIDDPFLRNFWAVYGTSQFQWEGRFDDALKHIRRWGGDVEQSSDAFFIFWNRWWEALAKGSKGEYEEVLAFLEDLLASCERVGEHLFRIRALNAMGWIYGELENYQPAMEWNTKGMRAAQEAHFPDPEVESNARLNLGDNLMALGRFDEAEEQFQWVEQVVYNPRPQDHFMLWRYSQRLFHSYGELWLMRGDGDRALAYAEECLALAEGSKSQKNIVKGRRLLGQALLAQGKLAEAEKELMIALEVAKRIGNPPQLWRTYASLGDLRQAQGIPDRAYDDALSVIEKVADNLTDESLKKTFLNSDHVQSIRRLAGKET